MGICLKNSRALACRRAGCQRTVSRATSRLGSRLQEALVVLWRLVWTFIVIVHWRLGRKTGCLEKRTRRRISLTSISAGDARTMNDFYAIAYGNARCARNRQEKSRH